MFSTATISFYYQSLIKLTTLEEYKLKAHLNNIKRYQRSPDQDGVAGPDCSASEFYKFSENNTQVKDFYQKKDCPFNAEWSRELKERGGFGEVIGSINQKRVLTIFDQYKAAYLVHEYKDKKKSNNNAAALDALALACQEGSYEALLIRNKLCLEKIKTSTDDKEKVIAYGYMMEDTKLLGYLFGSMGYFQGASIFSDMASYFRELSNSSQEGNPALDSLAFVFYQYSAEYFYIGLELINYHLSDNNNFIKYRCGDKELPEIFGFKDLSAVEESILASLDLDTVMKVYSKAKNVVRGLLEKGLENKN